MRLEQSVSTAEALLAESAISNDGMSEYLASVD